MLVKNQNHPKTINQQAKQDFYDYMDKKPFSEILKYLIYRFRVGLLMTGYPVIGLVALACFIVKSK